jgi:hypothetical protein
VKACATRLLTFSTAAGTLYGAIAAAALQGVDNEQQVRELDRQLHNLRSGITQQMDEARGELTFSRFNQSAYQQVVELADQIRRRLTAMAEDRSLYVHAQVEPGLAPSMANVVEKTTQTFSALTEAVRNWSAPPNSAELDAAVRELDADLARLRQQRVTAPFALDRMLPFWALVFNLREVAQDLKQLESTLTELAGKSPSLRQAQGL